MTPPLSRAEHRGESRRHVPWTDVGGHGHLDLILR
jgi:hypothetical protein